MSGKFGKKQEKHSLFSDCLRQAHQGLTAGTDMRAILLWGHDDYLIQKSARHLYGHAQRIHKDHASTKIDLNELDASAFQNLFVQQSLFDEGQIYLVQRCEQKSNFEKYLQSVTQIPTSHTCILTLKKNTLAKKVGQECERLGFFVIECVSPPPWRMTEYIQQAAKKNKLKVSSATANYMHTMWGDNLAVIDNELRRLSLIFDGKTQEISEQDIAKRCQLIREDDAFKIADLIMSGQQARVESSLQKLLADGIAPISLIGVIARLIRTAAYLKSPATAGEVRLPPSIKAKYAKFAQKISTKQLEHALATCQQADMDLKSSRANGLIALVQITQAMCLG